VADLIASGVPVEGEAGIGYRLGKDFELPPLMFNIEEVEALVLGMRMVGRWGDRDLARSAKSILSKLESVLPESESQKLRSSALFALSFSISEADRRALRVCRRAVNERRKLNLSYQDPKGQHSERTVLPLGLFFWGQTRTLGTYCELRKGFRNFRLDRIQKLRLDRESFDLAPPVTLEDYMRVMKDS
jgi:predicted DNA-binding transcriptional regulator YafY